MATGEKTWSSRGKTPAKFESKPIPEGTYDLKINGDWTQKVAEGEGKVPYLSGSFTALGTGANGGKDRRVFHLLFLELTPNKNGGPSMAEKANGVLGLVRGLGTEINPRVTTYNGKEMMTPADIKQFLLANEGAVVQALVKIEAGKNGYADKNRIEFFVEAPVQEGSEDTAAETVDTSADEDEAAFVPAARATAPARGQRRNSAHV